MATHTSVPEDAVYWQATKSVAFESGAPVPTKRT